MNPELGLFSAQVQTRRCVGLWLGRESLARGNRYPSKLGVGEGLGVSPVYLDVSEYLGSGAITGVWTVCVCIQIQDFAPRTGGTIFLILKSL